MCLSGGVGLGSGSRRKLSFKNVSNVVVQLLHSIKFNVDVPFSNMAASPQELKANAARKVLLKLIISSKNSIVQNFTFFATLYLYKKKLVFLCTSKFYVSIRTLLDTAKQNEFVVHNFSFSPDVFN